MASKTISDPVHGSIQVGDVALDLLETLEVQRLNAIRQLGLTYLVFPGANHSRLEHVLGTYHVAREIARHLELPEEEVTLVSVAGLLHDVGHGPFSHTLENVLADRTGLDHMEVGKEIILGKSDSVPRDERAAFGDRPRVAEVLETWGVDPRRVADLITGCGPVGGLFRFAAERARPPVEKPYLHDIVHGVLDADQIDYLLRDAAYTGVAHGIIDLPRLLATFRRAQDRLVVDRKGLSAVEGTLVARGLMYTSVYFHKTVRIAETMLARAVEALEGDVDPVRFMTDAELLSWLASREGRPRETALRLKYRRLFKQALTRDRGELEADELDRLTRLADPVRRQQMEAALARRARAPPGSVIVDVPAPELLVTEPRIAQVGLGVLEEGKVRAFRQVSTLAKALQLRETVDWALMVASDPAHREATRKTVERVLFA